VAETSRRDEKYKNKKKNIKKKKHTAYRKGGGKYQKEKNQEDIRHGVLVKRAPTKGVQSIKNTEGKGDFMKRGYEGGLRKLGKGLRSHSCSKDIGQ